jgi:hypothetical protein
LHGDHHAPIELSQDFSFNCNNPESCLTGEITVADDIEAELQAIKTLLETLEPLTLNVRNSVIEYVFKRLGITASHAPAPAAPSPAVAAPLTSPLKLQPDGPTDILSLKEQKGPTTGTQMIAVVAYYLAHLAPEGERRDFITVDDIQKYFVQGKYPLPGSQPQALVHAKNAGYLDSLEKGKYRLNSVGHNLVAHKMPKDGSAPARSSSGARRKPAKKTAKKSVKRAKK